MRQDTFNGCEVCYIGTGNLNRGRVKWLEQLNYNGEFQQDGKTMFVFYCYAYKRPTPIEQTIAIFTVKWKYPPA